MIWLNYDEQALIKMHTFDSKEELIEKLNRDIKRNNDIDLKDIVECLIVKLKDFSLEDLKNLDRLFE